MRHLRKNRHFGPERSKKGRRLAPPVLMVNNLPNEHAMMIPDSLVFRLTRPKRLWYVPPVTTPLYWFDMVMLQKKLIDRIADDVFVCDGRRFRVIAQDWRKLGPGYTRWLVYEEKKDHPNGGRP